MRWITCGVMPKMRCVPTPRLPRSTISSTVSFDIFTASPRRKLAEKAVYSQRNSGLGKNVKISLETCLATRERRLQAIQQGVAIDNAPGISCKRKEVLRLTLDEYKAWAEATTRGFEK